MTSFQVLCCGLRLNTTEGLIKDRLVVWSSRIQSIQTHYQPLSYVFLFSGKKSVPELHEQPSYFCFLGEKMYLITLWTALVLVWTNSIVLWVLKVWVSVSLMCESVLFTKILLLLNFLLFLQNFTKLCQSMQPLWANNSTKTTTFQVFLLSSSDFYNIFVMTVLCLKLNELSKRRKRKTLSSQNY